MALRLTLRVRTGSAAPTERKALHLGPRRPQGAATKGQKWPSA